jgi:HPt (histidine-containing phosphotransfer) domain-containing protein
MTDAARDPSAEIPQERPGEGGGAPAPDAERRILDLVHLARQTFGDRELERELLVLFEAQCRRLLPVLAGSGPAGERGDAAHTLKGAARAVGAWRIAAVAEGIEGALAAGPGSGAVAELVVDLERAVRETQEAARRWRDAA